jgi:hypothetical protein
MNCFVCYDKGEIYYATKNEFELEYCYCEKGYEKFDQHAQTILADIESQWYAGQLFTTPEAR